MPRARALRFVVVLMALALGARLLPYTSRLFAGPTQPVPGETPVNEGKLEVGRVSLAKIPARLGERPLALVAAGLLIEVSLLGSLLYTLLRSPHIAGTLLALSWRRRTVAVLLLSCTIVGFVAGNPQATFPFVPWRMFSGWPSEQPEVTWVVGTTADGQRQRIDLVATLAGLGHTRGLVTMLHLSREALRPDAADIDIQRQRLAEALQAVALLHQRQTGVHLTRIGVVRHLVDLTQVSRMDQLSPEPQWEVAVRR